ncbi:MAG: hypothetical protein RSF02_02585 [Bacilli bacterium]
MKKAMGIATGIAAASLVGGAAYVMINKKTRRKAEKMFTTVVNDANEMISKKIN